MSIMIAGIEIDSYEGTILLPAWSARPFVQPGVPNVGVAVQPPTSIEFTLRCTQLGEANQREALLVAQLDRQGRRNTIVDGTLDYAAAYNLEFYCLEISVSESRVIPFAGGTRNGTDFEYSPACRIVSDWRLLAVPI